MAENNKRTKKDSDDSDANKRHQAEASRYNQNALVTNPVEMDDDDDRSSIHSFDSDEIRQFQAEHPEEFQMVATSPGMDDDDDDGAAIWRIQSDSHVWNWSRKIGPIYIDRGVPSGLTAPHQQQGNDKKHKCDICKKLFPSGQALGGHRSTHARERLKQKQTRENTEIGSLVPQALVPSAHQSASQYLQTEREQGYENGQENMSMPSSQPVSLPQQQEITGFFVLVPERQQNENAELSIARVSLPQHQDAFDINSRTHTGQVQCGSILCCHQDPNLNPAFDQQGQGHPSSFGLGLGLGLGQGQRVQHPGPPFASASTPPNTGTLSSRPGGSAQQAREIIHVSGDDVEHDDRN